MIRYYSLHPFYLDVRPVPLFVNRPLSLSRALEKL